MNSQPLHAGSGFDRDRDLDEQRHRAHHQDDLARRERERERERDRDREREEAERQHREPYPPATASAGPHHSTAGSLPIHQPVASRISNSITGPGGLLANHGSSASSLPISGPSAPAPGFAGSLHSEAGRPPQQGAPSAAGGAQHQIFASMAHAPSGPNGSTNSLGGPGGPGAMFGGPLQQENGRGMPQDGARAMQQLPFGSSMGPGHAVPSGPGGMPQGQQPILNVGCMWLAEAEAGPAMGLPLTCSLLGCAELSRPSQSPVSRTTGRLQQVS